jgi:hypothetical protein
MPWKPASFATLEFRELHSDQGRYFKSKLMQEVLEHLTVSKTWSTRLHPELDGIVVQYVMMVKEHLRKVVLMYQRDWDERLPIFLLAYQASTHWTPGMMLTSMMFGMEFCLPCDLLFGAPPDKE